MVTGSRPHSRKRVAADTDPAYWLHSCPPKYSLVIQPSWICPFPELRSFLLLFIFTFFYKEIDTNHHFIKNGLNALSSIVLTALDLVHIFLNISLCKEHLYSFFNSSMVFRSVDSQIIKTILLMDIRTVFTFSISCATAFRITTEETHARLKSNRECGVR